MNDVIDKLETEIKDRTAVEKEKKKVEGKTISALGVTHKYQTRYVN